MVVGALGSGCSGCGILKSNPFIYRILYCGSSGSGRAGKVLEVMRQVVEPTSYTWDESDVQCAINSSLNSSLGDSLHFVLYGEEMSPPRDAGSCGTI